jgi:hypothetical protein
MRHSVQDDIYPLKDVIQDIMATSSSLPKRCTIGPLAHLNSMVSSWTTSGKATTAGSLLVFEDNVGEDGLPSKSTYKVNIVCLYYKASKDYGFARISITHLFSNWQSKRQFRNLPIGICQASCFKKIQTIKKSVCWVCVFTQKMHTVDILPHSQLCCLPY